ncbi:hypothetical protein [Streptomyces sp. Ru87]|uniref:hypothetical protein n=1 Tax=Streptomyces sp. Ru87 TaxID=2044307 RepID=UPI000BF65AAB|nr:hypothetical protein [Streptomyces sp. Ru87]PGH52302.1 hypothetical protein CRI70_02035 [Streptomyces sp. Ru87]
MTSKQTSSTDGARPDGTPRPARLTAAAAVTGAQGAVLAALGGYQLVMTLVGTPDSLRQALTGALTLLLLAALPLAAARGLWLLRRWSRGPAMITQLMAVPVAWTLIGSGGALVAAGIALAVSAAAVLVLVVNPGVTEALGTGPRE